MNYVNRFVVLFTGSMIWLTGCSQDPAAEAPVGGRVPPEPSGNPMVADRPAPTNWVTLNPAQRSALASAVNRYSLMAGKGPIPSVVQDLKPIEVYFRRMNVVIAIRREEGEEVGYYIQPWVSSFDIGSEPSPEWSFSPLSGADETGTVCHAYRRALTK